MHKEEEWGRRLVLYVASEVKIAPESPTKKLFLLLLKNSFACTLKTNPKSVKLP